MKKVDRIAALELLNTLLLRIKDFRETYRLSEATFWDLITIYFYQESTGKGVTPCTLSKMRYQTTTGRQALKLRRYNLIDRGLVTHEKGHTALTKKGQDAILSMINIIPVPILKMLLDPQYKIAA